MLELVQTCHVVLVEAGIAELVVQICQLVVVVVGEVVVVVVVELVVTGGIEVVLGGT